MTQSFIIYIGSHGQPGPRRRQGPFTSRQGAGRQAHSPVLLPHFASGPRSHSPWEFTEWFPNHMASGSGKDACLFAWPCLTKLLLFLLLIGKLRFRVCNLCHTDTWPLSQSTRLLEILDNVGSPWDLHVLHGPSLASSKMTARTLVTGRDLRSP